MSVVHWLRDHLSPLHRSDEEKLGELLKLTDEIKDTTNRLSRKMKLYARSRNPFAALLADVYTRKQVDDIYKGPEEESESPDEK